VGRNHPFLSQRRRKWADHQTPLGLDELQEHKLSGRTLRKLPVKAKIARPGLGGRVRRLRRGAGVDGEDGTESEGRGELVRWVRGMREAVEKMVVEGRRIQKAQGFEYGEEDD